MADIRNLKGFTPPTLPRKAIMNPNYLSLPSEWDSSVSQIEMLQRLLWNVNQIIEVLTVYADQMNELQTEYEDIVSKYQNLRDEIVAIIDGWKYDIDGRLDAQDAKLDAAITRQDEKIDSYEARIDSQDANIASKFASQDANIEAKFADQDRTIAEAIAGMFAKFSELEQNYLQIINDAIDNYTRHMIMFGLSDDGHFVAEYSDNWNDLTFNTTEYDISVPVQPEYGHLCLSY